jgi:SAM-dependent methyltransferase
MDTREIIERPESTPAVQLRCPVCKTTRFLDVSGRPNARCAQCLSMERTRLMWLVLNKLDLFRPGLRVMHIAPEWPIMKRYTDMLADHYYACDIDPTRYTSKYTTVRQIDLTRDLAKLPSSCFDVILHNHVLEHIRTDVKPVLEEFERILAPGGHHLFSLPVRGDVTIEDLSDDLSAEERTRRFGQDDHYRLFGRQSLKQLFDEVFGETERHHVEPLEYFSKEELATAAIPEASWAGVSGDTIFHHVRPIYRRVRAELEPEIERNANSPQPAKRSSVLTFPKNGTRLILHIGMPKAGTTSLQHWLFENREAALAASLDYWSIEENHSEVMFNAFAAPMRLEGTSMWFQRTANPKKPDRAGARARFDLFLKGLGGKVGCVSGEALWTFKSEEIKELADFLSDRGVHCRIICWIRPPKDFIRTDIQQRCRTMLSIGDFGLELQNKVAIAYSRLNGWMEHFGEDGVLTNFVGEDVVRQFRGLLHDSGIDIGAGEAAQDPMNRSISLVAVKALLALNEAQLAAGGATRDFRTMRWILHEMKGEEFALPVSVLQRLEPLFANERAYIAGRLGLDEPQLSEEPVGIDDRVFFRWTFEEVVQMLGELRRGLAEQREQQQKK